ncbi:MAG TPA: GNAT family N-acetyltransferase [Pseudolabrys sp.]|nr:GNAT family N-acetyltransferase [Pseudolabrys sp.]
MQAASARAYELRACLEADADFVVALTETVMCDHAVRTWGRWDPAYHRAEYHRAFGRLEHSIVICDGTEAGYLAIHRRDEVDYLQWLLLLPAFQNRGIGSAIVSDLIRTAAPGKPLQLRVLPVNAGARRLYERLGFAVTHTEGDFVYLEHPAGTAGRNPPATDRRRLP